MNAGESQLLKAIQGRVEKDSDDEEMIRDAFANQNLQTISNLPGVELLPELDVATEEEISAESAPESSVGSIINPDD